jgi:polysaccharide export outer membrane protein
VKRVSITIAALALLAGLGISPSAMAQSKLSTPSESGQNLPAQPVGPDDLLAISVYGAPELSRSQRVSPDGSLRLPMLKQPISVRGLLPVEIERGIGQALIDAGLLVDPVVSVNIAEFASRPVSVAGAVRRPVIFQATGRTTLLDAITHAEGLSADAGSEILVTRPPKSTGEPSLIERIAVQDLIERGSPAANLVLEGGEEVRVPEVGRVFIVGNVLKPGALPLNDAGGMTVLKALAMSEGLARFATKRAYIYRPQESGEKQEIEVELRKIMDRKSPDISLTAGDIFYIPDNRKGRLTASVIDRIVSFGAGTASGALVYAAR